MTLKTNIARKNIISSAGVFASLSQNYETAFANRNIRMTIRARQGQKNPLTHFDMGYFTADVGDSGWIRKPLTRDWQNFTLDFKPGIPVNDLGIDYAGIWPGDKGEEETMDVEFIKVEVQPKLKE